MGTITGIGDLDSVRWPNSHWRSVKVGWDESTASEKQPRVSLWEIEPLTTFPMYPSLFPLRLKRPWYPGASSFQDCRDGAVNGMAWLRGETAEQGLQTLNFQNSGIFPYTQQRMDPTFARNDLNQQYQTMLAAGLQNINSGDVLKQQFLQLQQPFQYLPQSGGQISLIQNQQQVFQSQNQIIQPEEQTQQQQSYQDPFLVQSNVPSSSFQKPDFSDNNTKYMATVAPVQNMLGSLCGEGTENNVFNFSRTMPPQQPWVQKFTHSHESSSLDTQNHALFGANIDSGLLLPTTISSVSTNSVNADLSSMPLGTPGFQGSMYDCIENSSELMHTSAQVDPSNSSRTFVKVYRSGSVGRSLDISRFNSYNELREELGQMFGIEGGFVEDPQRSGWQLVFVDRENDVLLLGDDPWESFVNNVWYIKILSPEDVLKLGKEEVESLGRSGNPSENDARDFVSGLSSLGTLEY